MSEAPAPPRTLRYGAAPSQEGDLHLPAARRPAVVCLLHGGFWHTPHGRDQLGAVARDLARRGFAAWNLGYRRVGEAGGGWPGTFEDVAAGIDHLSRLAAEGTELDLDRVIVAGHSAGGQLALWAAARGGQRRPPHGPARVRIAAAAAQAAILDLHGVFAMGAGRGAVRLLLGGAPEEQPARYAATSPAALLPLGVPQLILHGAADEALPVESARDYARAAAAAGDAVRYVELSRAGHMDYVDPASEAHAALCAWLGEAAGAPSRR